MGVGSQRQALEDSKFHRSFSVVREVAPNIPVVANIGAAEVAKMGDPKAALSLVKLVRADALAVHLNPLQELLQPEGTPAFRGVLDGIAMLVRELPVPIIVKEIGAGISADVARRLTRVYATSTWQAQGARAGPGWKSCAARNAEVRRFSGIGASRPRTH